MVLFDFSIFACALFIIIFSANEPLWDYLRRTLLQVADDDDVDEGFVFALISSD